MNAKDLRAITGLSQQGFSDKYKIPKNYRRLGSRQKEAPGICASVT